MKSIKSLQAKGILGVTHRAVGGFKKSNIYTLIVDDENASPRCERGSHRCEPDDQIDVNEVHIEPIKEPSIKNNIPFLEIVDYLNEKTGKSFRATTVKTKNLIKARWKEGFSLEDFKSVIDTMVELWSGQGEMELYLRPVTLFGEKFEGYLQKKLKNQKAVQLTPKQQQENDEWNRLLSQT